jgi:quinolinate synthase
VAQADLVGDSLELARHIPGLAAEHVVFCGVHFMAESAAILAKPGQKVHIPDVHARCTMADMAPGRRVAQVLDTLIRRGRRVVPLAYVNSCAEVKAVCGRHGGSVCTSANAGRMLEWAMGQGEGVLFLPDKHLARNTADALGIPPDRRHILDVRGAGDRVDEAAAATADLLIWPGACSIHHTFRPEHVTAVRAQHPGVSVVVHPECRPEVVRSADAAGSTSYIIRFVREALPGGTVAIGTEINLVLRLAAEYAGVKRILPLAVRPCANMARITEAKLLAQLDSLEQSPPVTVPPDIAEPARVALTRMLDVCG